MNQLNYLGSAAGTEETVRLMRYDAAKKSVGVAYMLWFFLGAFGVHRFYLGSWGIGVLILACTTLAFVTFGLTGLVSGLIMVLDLFLIPGKVRQHNERLIASLA
ncbi:MAG: TM2 domain-containing protein [Janthinobacterium lividum]